MCDSHINDDVLLPIAGAEHAQDLSLTAHSCYLNTVYMQYSCMLSRYCSVAQQHAPAWCEQRLCDWLSENSHSRQRYLALNILYPLQFFSLGFFNFKFHFIIICFCQHYQRHVISSSKCNFLVMYYCSIIYIAN